MADLDDIKDGNSLAKDAQQTPAAFFSKAAHILTGE